MYKIEITYITGNSFGSHETKDVLDLEWENLEIAKENLKAIKEHWTFYNKIENSYSDQLENQKIYTEIYNKYWWFAGRRDRWFVQFNEGDSKLDWLIVHKDKKNLKKFENNKSELRWDDLSHHRMKLKADNGNLMQQHNFWCGYFESLIGAKIINIESDTEFKI